MSTKANETESRESRHNKDVNNKFTVSNDRISEAFLKLSELPDIHSNINLLGIVKATREEMNELEKKVSSIYVTKNDFINFE